MKNSLFIGGPTDRYRLKRVPREWKWVKLTDVAELRTGHTPDRKTPEYWNGKIGWVSLQDTERLDQPEIVETTFRTNQAGIDNSSACLLPAGTVIFSRTATVGKSTILGEEMATSQDFMNYVCGPKVHNQYLMYVLRGMERTWHSLMAGSAHNTIYMPDFKKMRVLLPPKPIQIEVAEILSTWDENIASVESLISAKLKRKQAIVQQHLTFKWECWPHRKLGELFVNRKEKGTQGLPTYSVTLNDGLVLRETLERKTDTSLEPEEHLLIEKDDLAYNMMRMWQGASGLAVESGLVSPAYVVVRSKGEIDPRFASFWFKSPRVVKKFQDYSYGLTSDRLRLYFKDFAIVQLPVPPFDLQRELSRVLKTFDQELSLLEQRRTLLEMQRKGLMQQLLTGKTRVKVAEAVA